jgi:hypothetical protein
MLEYWLQKYIKEYYRQIGFTELHGPYNVGPDFKGVYHGRLVKIEAEWDYSDYINHQHPPDFAEILIVATLKPVPRGLREKLPSFIIHLCSDQVAQWARPRKVKKDQEDYISFTWRRLSRSLLYLYAYSRKKSNLTNDFVGSELAGLLSKSQVPAGFHFGEGGKEISFDGRPEEKVSWDFWLNIAHDVAGHFKLRPALLRPTWIDRVALYSSYTGRVTDADFTRFKDIALYIDSLLPQAKGTLPPDTDELTHSDNSS